MQYIHLSGEQLVGVHERRVAAAHERVQSGQLCIAQRKQLWEALRRARQTLQH
jgi:hypothetical protein